MNGYIIVVLKLVIIFNVFAVNTVGITPGNECTSPGKPSLVVLVKIVVQTKGR